MAGNDQRDDRRSGVGVECANKDGRRWYEFEQVEVMIRPFYVRAGSLAEARGMVRANKSGSQCGAPDYAPDGPSSIAIRGRGRLAGQDLAQYVADEREGRQGR